ncbi:substrate-binding domain-containing protein, partial [Patescibacteria group bacterium]|nr:substrate-binding domain-containing protein [Patescibacteria group bacterium]
MVLVLGLALLSVVIYFFSVEPPKKERPIVIYFFSGGPPGGTFSTVVYNGAKTAAEILGDRADVRYMWSDWNPQKMVSQFQEAVAVRPDGIAIMGHPGVDALKPFIDEAEKVGIIVTSQNVTLPELEEKYKASGFGYAGQDLYGSGYMLGKAAMERAGLGKGDRALVWGLKRLPTRGLRTRGAIDALEKAGLTVGYLEISPEVDKDASIGIPTIVGYLQKYPDCKLVITDHGQLTA